MRAPVWQRLSAGAAENITPRITLRQSESKKLHLASLLRFQPAHTHTHACRRQSSAVAAADSLKSCKELNICRKAAATRLSSLLRRRLRRRARACVSSRRVLINRTLKSFFFEQQSEARKSGCECQSCGGTTADAGFNHLLLIRRCKPVQL